MADDQNNGGGRIGRFLRHHALAFILGVVASIVASLLITDIGYKAGFAKGRIEGEALGREEAEVMRYEELDAEIETARGQRMSELDDEIEARREERKTALDTEIEAARNRRLSEVEKEVDDLVMAQCGREMQDEFDRGQRAGSREGLARGREEAERRVSEARREMDMACTQRIQEARSASELWNRFENLILSLDDYREQEPGAQANYIAAVIRVARAGREAGEDIARVFNGDIDELIEALEAGDLDRAFAILERLKLTLPDLYAIFEPAFDVLALGLEGDQQ